MSDACGDLQRGHAESDGVVDAGGGSGSVSGESRSRYHVSGKNADACSTGWGGGA